MSLFNINEFIVEARESFPTVEKCKRSGKKYRQTNPRFEQYDQSMFTAADATDFNKYGILQYVCARPVPVMIPQAVHSRYRNVDMQSILNTYNYHVKHLKKGIFAVIKNGKLEVYLPFSQHDFMNNYYERTFISESEKPALARRDTQALAKSLQYHVAKSKSSPILRDRRRWLANNCWFNHSHPAFEGELNYGVYYRFLLLLTEKRTVPDCAFFINARDFPRLNIDGTHPHTHLFLPSETIPVIVPPSQKMCPILSQSVHKNSADILFPTTDDMTRATQLVYPARCSGQYLEQNTAGLTLTWEDKRPVAIFRGGATGCGITPQTNPRLRLAELSRQHPTILNAGVTNLNAKMKKINGGPLQTIDRSTPTVTEIDNKTKSTYKYFVNVDGSVNAFRLAFDLSMGSVILSIESEYQMWYSQLLIPMVHYVPVAKDLSNLISQIEWCISHDAECKVIAANALELYNTKLSVDGILDAANNQLRVISSNMAHYVEPTPKKSVAIISCYRDSPDHSRRKQLTEFKKIAASIYVGVDIYIVEQGDDLLFNIGKLKNIGFLHAQGRKKYDHYIFSDIDTVPDHELMPFIMHTPNSIMCLAHRGSRYDTSLNKPFLGSLISVPGDMFTKINGYPNNFFGWGGEDDSLIHRCVSSKIYAFEIPNVGSMIDLEEFSTAKNKTAKLKQNGLLAEARAEKLLHDMKHWQQNGLNSIEYTVLDTHTDKNITTITVDLNVGNLGDVPIDTGSYDKLKLRLKETNRQIYNKTTTKIVSLTAKKGGGSSNCALYGTCFMAPDSGTPLVYAGLLAHEFI